MTDITAILHITDDARATRAALASTTWAGEVVVVGARVPDHLASMSKEFAHRVERVTAPTSSAEVLGRCVESAAHEWVLFLDQHEALADDAAEGLDRLVCERGGEYDAFALPRFNYVDHRVVRVPPLYPDPQVRLFRRGHVRFEVGAPGPIAVEEQRCLCVDAAESIHVHRRACRNVRDLLRERLDLLLGECSGAEPEPFHFEEYTARAYALYASSLEEESEPLRNALAILVSWEELCRGLLHWDALEHKPELDTAFTLPVATVNRDVSTIKVVQDMLRDLQDFHAEVERLRESHRETAESLVQARSEAENRQAQLDAIQATRMWRISRRVQGVYDWLHGRGRAHPDG